MNEKIIRALLDAGAVRQVRIVGNQSHFHVEIDTTSGRNTAMTLKGGVKTWSNLHAAAKWIRSLGVGEAKLELSGWTPNQRSMSL